MKTDLIADNARDVLSQAYDLRIFNSEIDPIEDLMTAVAE